MKGGNTKADGARSQNPYGECFCGGRLENHYKVSRCKKCDVGFSCPILFEQHCLEEHPCKCEFLPDSYDKWKEHTRSRKCKKCKVEFRCKVDYNTPLRTHLKHCEPCGKSFGDSHWSRHISTEKHRKRVREYHSDTMPKSCVPCGMQFSTGVLYDKHVQESHQKRVRQKFY